MKRFSNDTFDPVNRQNFIQISDNEKTLGESVYRCPDNPTLVVRRSK